MGYTSNIIFTIFSIIFLVLLIFAVNLSRSSYKQSNTPAFISLLLAILMQFIVFTVGSLGLYISLQTSKCPLPSTLGNLVIIISFFSIISLVISFLYAFKNHLMTDKIAYLITFVLFISSGVGAYFISQFCIVG